MTTEESQALFRQGLEAGKKRDYRQAVACFTPLCENDDPKAFVLLGRSWHGLGEFSHAVQVLQSALYRFGGTPELHFFLGRSLLASGQPNRAVSYLEKALEARWGGFQVWGLLGTAYLKAKNPAKAVQTLEKAVEAAPAHRGIYIAYLNALVVRAVQLFHQGDHDLSRQMLDFLVQSGAESPMIDRYLASAWRELGHPEKALVHLEKALKDKPEDTFLVFQRIEALFLTGQTEEARRQIASVGHLLPPGTGKVSGAILEKLLPLQALQQGNLRKAVFYAQKGLQTSPQDSHLILVLAEAHRQLGQLSKAENHFERARKLSGNQKEPDYGLMMVHWQQGRYAEALTEAQRLLDRDPEDQIVQYYSALLRCRLNQDPQTNIQMISALIHSNQPDPFLFSALAGEYQKVGLEDLALPWVKRALQLDSENKAAMDLFAALLPSTGREDWKPFFLEYLKLRPQDQEILKIFISKLIHSRDFSEAQKRLLDWIALGHRSPGALRSLGYVYRMQNLFAEAFLVYRDLLKTDPQNSEYISAVILCLYRSGKKDMAVEFSRKALGQNPANPKMHYQMGQLFLSSGDWDQARKAFNKVLELDENFWPAVEKLAEIYQKTQDQPMADRYRKHAQRMRERLSQPKR